MTMEPSLFPREFTLKHYEFIFSTRYPSKDFPQNVLNSLIVGISTSLVSNFLAVIGAYGLSRYPFPGSETFSRMMLIVYVLPGIPLLLPIYGLLAKMKLTDNLFGLMFVYIAINTPFVVWFLKSFFQAIPVELEEAAKVDGASSFRAFVSITLPISLPGIVTTFMYVLVTTWGEYSFAQIIITSDWKKTVPLGLATYMTDQYIEWGPLLAATTLVVIPIILLFLPFTKQFISGLSSGALKD